MAIGAALRTGIRIASKIDKKYNLNKIFIDKYVPPGHRQLARRAFDIAGIGGMVISGISYYYDNAFSPQKPFYESPTNKFGKTYRGQTRRNSFKQSRIDYCNRLPRKSRYNKY